MLSYFWKWYNLLNTTILPDEVGDVGVVVISSMVVISSIAGSFSVFVFSVTVDFSVFATPSVDVAIVSNISNYYIKNQTKISQNLSVLCVMS